MLILNVLCTMLNALWAVRIGYGDPMIIAPLLLIALTVPTTIAELKKL